uniref:TGF-beta family profile domain-containing protein n=1 Tax=Gopherus evgoodei TaxID=1825980 RepID=A0A8C4YMC3_9SAUR
MCSPLAHTPIAGLEAPWEEGLKGLFPCSAWDGPTVTAQGRGRAPAVCSWVCPRGAANWLWSLGLIPDVLSTSDSHAPGQGHCWRTPPRTAAGKYPVPPVASGLSVVCRPRVELSGARKRRPDQKEAMWKSRPINPSLPPLSAVEHQTEASAGSSCYNLVLSRTKAFHQELSVVRAELRLFEKSLSTQDVSRLNVSWPSQVEIYQLPEPGQHNRHPKLLHSYILDATTLNVSAFLATNRTSQGAEMLNLESLKVSFQDIGWSDWVIAPNSYYMKFCEGSCPHNYKPASMHAQIKARMHTLSKETPAPCCVPAGYDPMVLMHYNGDGRLVSTLFEDMIVTTCHCA